MLFLARLVRTVTGRRVMSMMLGLGLASLFSEIVRRQRKWVGPSRTDALVFRDDQSPGKCVHFEPVAVKCDWSKQIVPFAP